MNSTKTKKFMGYISSEQLAKIKQQLKENRAEYLHEKRAKKNQQRLERINKTFPSQDELYNHILS